MTIYGWDASHFDAVPDGARVVSEGISFMTHKAGGDANDGELAAWWAALKPQRDKVLLGAYWVLRPDLTSSAVTAANAFLNRLDDQCPGWEDGPFLLQLDCEQWNGKASTAPNLAYIKTFANQLVHEMPKLRPVVYAPKWVYGNGLTGLGYPLWASAYVTGSGTAASLYPGGSSSGWDAYSGQTPAILQFTDSATIAGQTTCDANAYRGTLAQLKALVAPGWSTDVTMTLSPDDVAAVAKAVWNYVLNVEIGPGKPADLQPAGGVLRYLSPYSVAIRQAVGEPGPQSVVAQVAALGTGVAPVITQAQLDQAVLNALKTLAGGQS